MIIASVQDTQWLLHSHTPDTTHEFIYRWCTVGLLPPTWAGKSLHWTLAVQEHSWDALIKHPLRWTYHDMPSVKHAALLGIARTRLKDAEEEEKEEEEADATYRQRHPSCTRWHDELCNAHHGPSGFAQSTGALQDRLLSEKSKNANYVQKCMSCHFLWSFWRHIK